MIVGVGTDIIEIDRIRKACEKEAFLLRTYTELERQQADGSASMFAGDFAVKEAVSKCFGTGFAGVAPDEIEALRDEFGKPYAVLHGRAIELAKKLNISRIHVSISDTKEIAIAFAVAEEESL